MNTPAHLILGIAAFARPASSKLCAAAALGAMLPDASLYVLAGVSLFVLAIPPETVFGTLYYSPAWQTVFAIDNSFIVWGVLLLLAARAGSAFAKVLCLAALLHIALDLPLHHDDGRAHFWPLSDWVYQSPLSYWDRGHGANWIAPLEAALTLVGAGLLWLRKPPYWVIGLVTMLLCMELWVVGQWLFFFGTNSP